MRLSADELRRLLKEQLDDPAVTEITDERLLVKGLLDSLLAESPDYAVRYRIKAQEVVFGIYRAVQVKTRMYSPKGFWDREQGLLNAGIALRPIIAQQGWVADRTIFKEFSTTWIREQGLREAWGKHGLYRLLGAAYPEYAFDPKQPTAFHLHPWDMTPCLWSESLTREAVRHTVCFHMSSELSLGELMKSFNTPFLQRENLYGILKRFNGNPYRLFVFGFPEYVFDPAHPDRPHVHPWDASSVHWYDDLILEAIRHTVRYHTDWADEDIAIRMDTRWLRRKKLWGAARGKFDGSPLRLLEFVYPELFGRAVLSEDQFRVYIGKGVARFRHPLRSIPESGYIQFGNKTHYFPQHSGYLVNKMSQEYGALYTPDRQIVGLFKWNTDSNTEYVRIEEGDIELVPLELTQPRRHLAFADAVRVLADEVQIVVHNLPLGDQTALTDALNATEPSRVIDYLKLTGATGLRAMADTEFSAALVLVHELFDPLEFRQVLDQYNRINVVLVEISSLFTRHAGAIQQEMREEFRAELNAKFFAANDRIINALSEALIYRDRTARDMLITDVLQAQRDMMTIVRVLDAFRQDALRLVRQRNYQDGTRDLHYTYHDASLAMGMDIYLVLRPRQNSRGQARIGFRIVPHAPAEAGLSHELSLRWDRETSVQTALDIHSDAFVRLGRLDRRQFLRGYHYEISGAQFAEMAFVEQIVQSFLPSRFRSIP